MRQVKSVRSMEGWSFEQVFAEGSPGMWLSWRHCTHPGCSLSRETSLSSCSGCPPQGASLFWLALPDPNCASHHVHSHPHSVTQTRNLETNYISLLPCLLTPSNPGSRRCPLQRSWSRWLSSLSMGELIQWEPVGSCGQTPKNNILPRSGNQVSSLSGPQSPHLYNRHKSLQS